MKTLVRPSCAARSLRWPGFAALVAYLVVFPRPIFAQDRSTPASQPVPIPLPTVEDVPALLEQLGHTAYKVRKLATEQLKRLPRNGLTEPLAKHYKTTQDYEVKLLIKEIAQTVYLMEHEEGFLGVGLDPGQITRKKIPRFPENTIGIRITLVLKGTVASAAGLKNGDIILACNGKPVPPGVTEDASKGFRELIASFRPRMPMTLDLLRGDRKLRVSLKLGTRPEEYWTGEKLANLEAIDKSMRAWWRDTFESNPDKAVTGPGNDSGNDTPPTPTQPTPTPPPPGSP